MVRLVNESETAERCMVREIGPCLSGEQGCCAPSDQALKRSIVMMQTSKSSE